MYDLPKDCLIMVSAELSGVQFGLKSFARFMFKIGKKRNSLYRLIGECFCYYRVMHGILKSLKGVGFLVTL